MLEKGELVYYVGAVAVVYNRMDERQRHYRGHTEDISCMDLHPLGDTVVSGQGAGQGAEQGPQVHVWNVHSMDTLQVGGHGMSRCHLTTDTPAQVLGLGSLQGGVAGVGFSALNKGAYVVAVDSSKDKVLHAVCWCDSIISPAAAGAAHVGLGGGGPAQQGHPGHRRHLGGRIPPLRQQPRHHTRPRTPRLLEQVDV